MSYSGSPMGCIQRVVVRMLPLLLGCLVLPICGLAEQELQFDDIIQLLDHAGQQFSYVGSKFVTDYTPTRRSTTLVKVTHDASGIQKSEVSSFPNDESQILLDDGKFLWHYIPSQAAVVKKQRRVDFGELSKRLLYKKDLIQQNYHITIETKPQSSQPSNVVQPPLVMGDIMVLFQPKTQDRPSWKMWLDSVHGLVVRTEIYDIDGNLAMLSGFTDLTFQPQLPKNALTMMVPKGTVVKTSTEETFQTIEEAQPHVSFAVSIPDYLPSGFLLWSVIVSQTEQREKVQLTYIDGMSSISVFEEKSPSAPTAEAETKQEVPITSTIKGTFNDHGLLKVLNWPLSKDISITLVGEVADTDLLKMASSMSSPEQ